MAAGHTAHAAVLCQVRPPPYATSLSPSAVAASRSSPEPLAGSSRVLCLAAGAGRSGNLVFSPLCLYAALSLWATGARERTLNELLGVLGVPSRDVHTFHVCTLARQALTDRPRTGGPRVSFASGVWHDRTMPIRPAYRDAAESFKAVARAVNFRQKVSATPSSLLFSHDNVHTIGQLMICI